MNSDTIEHAWNTLYEELDNWQNEELQANFWWRDDDACTSSAELKLLTELSDDLGIPLSLAVIPAGLQNSLVDKLKHCGQISVLQHGYAHQSHAVPGAKKIEIGGDRDTAAIGSELVQGREALQNAFGDQFVSVLVPPWNRIEARTYPTIIQSGFIGLSTMWARINAYPATGLQQVNCHMDPVDWRGDRGFIGDHKAIEAIQLHLLGRRVGILDRDEPTGILTHHLDQSEAVWQFCRVLFSRLLKHPAVQWQGATDIWGN